MGLHFGSAPISIAGHEIEPVSSLVEKIVPVGTSASDTLDLRGTRLISEGNKLFFLSEERNCPDGTRLRVLLDVTDFPSMIPEAKS